MSPLGDDARGRILARAREREDAHRRGYDQGFADATATVIRRQHELERRIAALELVLAREVTQRIERPEGANGG